MAKRVTVPIMTPAQEKFMASEGLLQWTHAVIMQAQRVSEACKDENRISSDFSKRHPAILAFHTECHYFAVAANKLLECRDWALSFGLCSTVDFSEIDSFPKKDIIDLRDMREHVVDYFKGIGRFPSRWTVTSPDSIADASSVGGTVIGGRLDWVKFAAAAERLLPALLAEPIPYPT